MSSPESRSGALSRDELIAFVREQLDNCHLIAPTKTGADRAAWLDDARFHTAILSALSEIVPTAPSAPSMSPSAKCIRREADVTPACTEQCRGCSHLESFGQAAPAREAVLEVERLEDLYRLAHRQVQPNEADQRQARREKIEASAAFIAETILAWPLLRDTIRALASGRQDKEGA